MKAMFLLALVPILAAPTVLAITQEQAGSDAGTAAAESVMAKNHQGQDLTIQQVKELANNPPKCPSDDATFCEQFNAAWASVVTDEGFDRED